MSESQDLLIELLEKIVQELKQARIYEGKAMGKTKKDGLELLDTPGILWPKFENREVGFHLAMTGAIKDEILPFGRSCLHFSFENGIFRKMVCATREI